MVGLRRAALALLIVAVGGVPLAINRCAAVCAAARGVVAATSARACHHAGSPSVRIGRVPAPCGQDHNLALSIGARTTDRPSAKWEATVAAPSSSIRSSASRRVSMASDRPVHLAFHPFPSPLRI